MYLDIKYEKSKVPWKDFENKVADIFESFNYKVLRNINFKTGRRYQIDLIAFDKSRVFCVDCKFHKYISPSIENYFTLKQIERMREYLRIDIKNFVGKRIFFLLVTRYANGQSISNFPGGRILSVSEGSLNDLLNRIELYEENLLSFKFY
ncbi:MAG: nuclease-related domain-containing protein [Candidatus Acidifodinimicrobium sp.]